MIHEEGTEFRLMYAFFEDLHEEYVAIYTEHHGFFVYAKEDLIHLAPFDVQKHKDQMWEGKDLLTPEAYQKRLTAEKETCECGKPIIISDHTKPGDAAWGGMCEECSIKETLRRT